MRSESPHSQRGTYLAFQRRSKVGSLTSPLDNNVTPVPLARAANGIQSMVATQYTEELKVAYGPAQLQEGSTQTRQHFQHHQLESQASTASTGCQYPKSGDSVCTPRNNCHLVSRKANADLYSSVHVSAQHSSYFGTPATENSARQSVYNGGKRRKCSKRNFNQHFLKGSNLNNNTGLQQRRHLNCALAADTSSAAPLGDGLGIAAQTCPNESNANIELTTNFSDERHCKSQRVKTSLVALNCGQTRMEYLDHSGGTHSMPHRQEVSFPSPSSLPSTDKDSLVGETEPPTDDQILNFIAKKLAYFRSILTEQNRNYGHAQCNKGCDLYTNNRDFSLQSDCVMPKSNSVVHLPTSSTSEDEDVDRQSLNCALSEQCTAAVGQAFDEATSKGNKANADLTKSKETGDSTTSASEKRSTGTLVSAVGNSKHATKNESVDKSALADFDLPVKKHLMPANDEGKLVYSDDCDDKTLVCSNDESFHSKWCDKYLENGMTTLHYSLTALKELIASLDDVEAIAEMDNFSKVILQQYWNGDINNIHLFASTEYPQIMMNVAATCAKNEEESPVVLTAVPEMTLDELTDKHPSLTLNCSLSQEYRPHLLNINNNLDDKDQVPGQETWALKHMTEKEKGDTGLKPVETVGLDNMHAVTQTKRSSVASENKQLTSHIDNQDANTIKMKNTEDQQHCGVICKPVIAHRKLNSTTDNILIHNVVSVVTNQSEQLCKQTSSEGVREDEGSVRSQTGLSTALPKNKVIVQTSLSESKGEEALSVNIVKDPQYEDISDDDMSQSAKKLLSTVHEEITFPAGFEDPQYEDISEDENPHTKNMSVERPSLTQAPECMSKQSPFQNKGTAHVQAQMKTEIISDEALIRKKQVSPKTESLDIAQHCSGPCFVETDGGFEGLLCAKYDSKTHLGCQRNHSVSCSPSSVLENEDETDNQMDDDWIVIPINMSDLKYEPEDEDLDVPEKVVLDDCETGDERPCDTSPTHTELHWPAPNPVLTSASSEMEVFDTVESFLQAKAVQFNTFEVDSKGEPDAPQNRQESYSEPEDSCETEDSCDYSSGSEYNYLTVSRELLKRSAPLPPETDDSVSEKGGEHDEVTNVQNGQTRSLGSMQKLRQLTEAGPTRLSKTDDIIILDSDSEDENDQNCKKKAKRKRLFSSVSEDSGEAPCSQPKKHSPETVDSQCGAAKEKFQENRWPSVNSPVPQRQSALHHTQFKEVMQIAHSDLSHSTEKGAQLIDNKVDSENVQHKVNRHTIPKKEPVITIDSDTEDEDDQYYKKANRRLSLGSAYSGDSPFVQQERHSSETVDSDYGTANGRIRETRQLIKPKGGFEHVQHKTNRQMTSNRRIVFHDSDKVVTKDYFSKKNVNTKTIHSSGSEDSGDALFAAPDIPSTETVDRLCGAANKKPEKPRLSCDDSPEMQPQCADEEAESTLDRNPFIPRLVVLQSSQPNDRLKLRKESREVYRQGKDETEAPKPPTATRKKTDSYEKNTRHLHRNKKGRFVSKPNPENDGHHAVQANITKPSLVSRQHSLPSQEAPSTSFSSLSYTSGQLSEARRSSSFSRSLFQSGENSASSSLPKSMQSTSVSRQHVSSSKLQRSHSSNNTYTKGRSPVTMQSAKEQVAKDWKKTYFPIQRDRKTSLGMDKDLRTTNYHSWREARPGPSHYDRPPRQRHHSHEPVTPLMKRTKIDAIQWTKATNRDAPRELSVFF